MSMFLFLFKLNLMYFQKMEYDSEFWKDLHKFDLELIFSNDTLHLTIESVLLKIR